MKLAQGAVESVTLPIRDVHSNMKGLMAGWGLTTSWNTDDAELLQKLEMNSIDRIECWPRYPKIMDRPDAFCVYKGPGYGVCFVITFCI